MERLAAVGESDVISQLKRDHVRLHGIVEYCELHNACNVWNMYA